MRKGEVWLLNLEPTIGAEIKKTRPVIIVNEDTVGILPLKIIVPVTDWKNRYSVASWMIRLNPNPQNGLDKISAADTFQVRSVAQERFVKQLGKLEDQKMLEIAKGLAAVLGI